MQFADVVYITPANKARYAFGQNSNISRGLQEVMLFYPGQIKPREGSKFEFEPLMRSSPHSVTYEWEEYVIPSPMGGIGGLQVPPEKQLREPMSPVIAARIKGKAEGDAKKPDGEKDGKSGEEANVNVVFVADMDMLADTFFFIRDKEWQGIRLDNITFILNAVDELAGDDAFLAIRSRRAQYRTLSRVEELTVQAKSHEAEAAAKADADAKKSLAEARKRLQEEAEKIREDKTLDSRTRGIKLAAAQENESRRFAVEELAIKNAQNKKVKQFKGETEREVRQIEEKIRVLAIALPPVPALMLGIFIFAIRARDERQGIIPDRMVGKQHN
jgi:ABC-2 type transport system permease protein